jgi:hypothetical protein
MPKPDRLIFLGGTSGRSPWRAGLIERLAARGVARAALFDPVVADWNEAARKREEDAKRRADLLVFYLGDPEEPGIPVSAFSLVEATLAVTSDDRRRTVLIFDLDGVDGHARKVYQQSEALLSARAPDVPIFQDLRTAEDWIARWWADLDR